MGFGPVGRRAAAVSRGMGAPADRALFVKQTITLERELAASQPRARRERGDVGNWGAPAFRPGWGGHRLGKSLRALDKSELSHSNHDAASVHGGSRLGCPALGLLLARISPL